MGEMEEKLNAILSNPEMMGQISKMAQSMGMDAPTSPGDSFPGLDIGMLSKLSGIAQNSAVDSNQQSLLHALSPYLSGDRISRLERAMRAARMAKLATGLMGQPGFQL